MSVGCAIAFGAVVGVVKMELRFVATKTFVVVAVDGGIIVDASEDRFAIAPLDQEWR